MYEPTHTFESGTRPCPEKGSFGKECKWWARETPGNGLQVREKGSDLWRKGIIMLTLYTAQYISRAVLILTDT